MGANKARSIAVIGGGIGGLTAALAFARQGADVTVYEQAPALTEVGAGLQITPNAARVLAALGVDLPGIRADAVVPMDAISGRQVARFDLRGSDYKFVHRAEFIDVLSSACMAAGVRVRTGCVVESVDLGGRVLLRGGEVYEATLVVGADGLHSVVRGVLNDVEAPFFTGQVAWRAIVDCDARPEARIWMAPGKHVVTYPLSNGRLNVVAVQERSDWAAEGWNHADEPENLRAVFGDVCPELHKILNKIETLRLWGLFRHPVADVWGLRQVAIVGDAAHPTLPFLAQGANLAIEDSYVLARVCDADASLDRALMMYQNKRRARVVRAIEAANANAVNYHLSGAKRRVAHAGLGMLSRFAPGLFMRRLSWLYDHDVTVD